MPRTSKVRRLPPELREQLHAMLDASHTLEEITAHLKALGADVSRSGLGRYKQQVDKVAARLRESRAMAEAVMERMGAQAATGKSGAALIEMLTRMPRSRWTSCVPWPVPSRNARRPPVPPRITT